MMEGVGFGWRLWPQHCLHSTVLAFFKAISHHSSLAQMSGMPSCVVNFHLAKPRSFCTCTQLIRANFSERSCETRIGRPTFPSSENKTIAINFDENKHCSCGTLLSPKEKPSSTDCSIFFGIGYGQCKSGRRTIYFIFMFSLLSTPSLSHQSNLSRFSILNFEGWIE